MLKKFSLVFLLLLLMTTGCNLLFASENLPYIEAFGPNEIECHSFYHYTFDDQGLNYIGLKRYDLVSETDQDIYIVENPEIQELTGFYGDDDGVYYVVTTSQEQSKESILFYYDLNLGTMEELLTDENHIGVYKESTTNEVMVKTKTQSYSANKGTLQFLDDCGYTGRAEYSHESNVELVTDDGTMVEINKEYKERNFTYTINGTTNVITALSDCGGSESGVYRNFVIEGDNVVGIVQITKGTQGGITPTNCIPANKLKKEVLVSFNYKTGESEILYNTKSNAIRIIGYSDGNVFLYKKGKIICRHLNNGDEEELYKLSYKGNGQLTFNWVGRNLVIFDEDNLQVVANIKT
jgi:hypothetical protein